MHLPSERVYREMRSEEVSIWFVPANEGKELAFLIKAPSSAIKGLIAGCPLRLLFGRKGAHLSAGAQILDMPDAPMLISGAQLQIEEHYALSRAVQERRLPVFLFNEIDICLAWTNLELTEKDSLQVAEMLGDIKELYTGPFSKESSHVLDCFCYSVDSIHTSPGAEKIPLVDIPTVLEQWRANSISFIGTHDHHTINIDNLNEGEMFERAIWASLESVFSLTLHKSPQVRIGEKIRELTDVLAFHEYGCFLIEAKDLSVLQAGYDRDQERRTKGVQKQIKKAVAQLVGASKAIARGEIISDSNGEKLEIIRDKPSHCIVLITELMHWGEWSEIEECLINAMRSTNAFFHLLDLREFIILLKASSGKATLFDYNLMNRCQSVVDNGVFVRSKIAPSPSYRDSEN